MEFNTLHYFILLLFPILLQVQLISKPSPVPGDYTSFKRPNPPTDSSNLDAKRRKLDVPSEQLSPLTSNAQTTTQSKSPPLQTLRQVSAPEPSPSQQNTRPKWQRCHSESHVSIMKALNKSCKYLFFYLIF